MSAEITLDADRQQKRQDAHDYPFSQLRNAIETIDGEMVDIVQMPKNQGIHNLMHGDAGCYVQEAIEEAQWALERLVQMGH